MSLDSYLIAEYAQRNDPHVYIYELLHDMLKKFAFYNIVRIFANNTCEHGRKERLYSYTRAVGKIC